MNVKLAVIVLIVVVVTIVAVCLLSYAYIRKNIKSGGKHINEFLKRHHKDPSVFDPKDFPWSRDFRFNWKTIRDELNEYCKTHEIPAYKDIDKGLSADADGWKALFLRMFGNDTDIMSKFPKTKALIDSCPCTTAYFSMLEPGTHIPPHVGIYNGVLRYHLGLKVPKDWKNCFIVVNNKKLHWHEGQDIMFDDSYLHHVENNTNERRIVLFLDIKRDFGSVIINAINTIMLKFIKCNDVLTTTVDKANRLNRANRK